MRSPRTLLASLWTAGIFVVCWTPRAYVPEGQGRRAIFLFPHFDKAVHFAIFAGFALCWLRARPARTAAVFGAGLLVALVSELGQANAIVRRDASWPDGCADALGILAGILAFHAARRLRPGPEDVRVPSAETP